MKAGWRRTVRVLAYLSAGLLLLFALLHTAPAKDALRGLLLAAVGDRLQVGELDYRLWRGEISARDVSWTSPTLSARVPEVVYHYVVSGPDRISVRGAEFELSLGEEGGGASETPGGAFSIPGFLLGQEIRLDDGALRLDGPWGGVELRAIGVHLTPSLRGWRGELAAEDGTVRLDAFSEPVPLERLEASVVVSGNAVQVDSARASSGTSSVSASGEIGSFSPFSMTLDARHDLDGELLARIDAELRLEGQIEGEAHLSFRPGAGLRAEGTARTEAIVYDELEPVGATVPWSFGDDAVEVRSAELEGYGGRGRLDVTLDLAADEQSLEASLSGIELSRIEPRLASRLGATVSARTSGFRRSALDGQATIELSGESGGAGVPLRGTIEASASGGAFRFRAPALGARSLRIDASGRLDETLDARFQAFEPSLDELPALLSDLGVSSSGVPLAGSLTAEGTVTGTLPDLVAEASLTSSSLRVADVPLELHGRLRWAGSRWTLDELRARESGGGSLVVSGGLPTGEGGGRWDLLARAESFDLSVASPLAGTSLGGTLDGEARVTGSSPVPDVDATLHVRGLAVSEAFGGDVSATIRERNRRLEIARLSASRDGGQLELQGQIDLDAETFLARAQATGWNLAWIPPLTSAVSELEGTLTRLDLDLEGRIESPEGRASATLEGLRLRGVDLPSTIVEMHSDGERAAVAARLSDGAELLAGSIDLRSPYPARVELHVGRVPWTPLLKTLPRLEAADAQFQIEGTAELELPLSEPSSVRYALHTQSLLATYRDLVFGASAPFTIRGDLERMTISSLSLVGSDTALEVDGTIPLSESGSIDVAAKGALRLELLQPWTPQAEPSGQANATLRVQGTLSEPSLSGDVLVEEASFVAGGVPFAGFNVAARWINNVLVLQHASGSVAEGTLRLHGEIAPRPSGEIHTHVQFELQSADPTSLVEDELPFQSARLSLSGELEGDARRPETLGGEGEIGEVEASTGTVTLASDGPASWTLSDGELHLPTLRLTGGSTDVVLEARARPFAEPPALGVSVNGVFDHGLLSPMLAGAGVTVSGLTRLSVDASLAAGELTLQGQGSWSGARVSIQEPPLAITELTGTFDLQKDRIVLNELTASAGGGRVQASGEIGLAGTSIGSLDLSAEATNVRSSYPEGLRSQLDASLRLTGSPETMRLSGQVTLDRAVFSRNINVESELLRSFTRVRVPTAPSEAGPTVRLDLTVRAEDALRVDNNLAQLGATANLTISGTLEAPEVYGVASTQSGGRFRFGRNVYQIETGRIQFRGYPQQSPEIDVTARTNVSGYDLRLSASGTMDNLVTNLDAPGNPELGRADVASLLVTGRTADKLSSEGRTVIEEQMTSYLGATLADLAELGLGQALPFQLTTVEPTLIAREVDPGARFTIGAAFTEDLTVVYSIGLTDAEQQFWLVDYALPKRARAQMIRQDNNEYTFGLLQQLPLYLRERPQGAVRTERRAVVESSQIVYAGEERPEAAEALTKGLTPKPGSRYDYWQAWEQADQIRRELRDEGYLEATVDVETPSCGEGCVDVRYRVDLGLPVAFVWEGGIDEELGDALAAAWNGRLGESFLVSDLAQLAEGRLFARGFFLARAEASTQRTDQGLTVTVSVERGPRGDRVEVSFPGDESIDEETLLAALPERRSPEFYDLLTVKRPRLKQQLRLVYAARGYLGTQVGDPETSFDAGSGVFRVRIPVTEGPQYRVESIDFQGVEAFSESALRALLPLRVGGVFRADAFVDARSAIAAYYRQQGFPDVEVEASVVDGSAEGELVARFVVREGERATVGEVTIAGNQATRDSVVRREVALHPGDPLRLSAVSETQKQLYDLDVFRSAEVVVGEPEPGTTRRDVTVRVTEAADLRLDYGLRAGTDGFFEVLGEINAINLFGLAHHAGLRTLVGSERQIYRFNYHSPYLSRFKLDTDFFVEREYQDVTPEAGTPSQDRTWTFTAQQTRALFPHLNAQWSYSYQRAESEFDDPFFGHSTIQLARSFLTGSIIGDARNSVVRPTRGTLWSSTFQASPRFLGSDTRFVKLYSQLFAYVPFGDGFVWASGYRLGLAKLLSDTLLEEDRFQAGGPNTLRGFAQGSLGPFNSDANAVIGGAGLLVVNQELRFPLFWRLRGAGFWDAGNTFETVSDMSLGELRHDLGLGVRVDMPFGLLRLDWAWVLAPRPGEKPWRIVFSLGQAF